jgi:hypothetical protein
MEIRLFESCCATVAAVAHVVDEGDASEIIDVAVVDALSQV